MLVVAEEDGDDHRDQLRQAASQIVDVQFSTERKSEPRILPPQKPIWKFQKRPIYPLEQFLWVWGYRVARVYPIQEQDYLEHVDADIDDRFKKIE